VTKTVLATAVSIMSAFAIAKFKFRGRKLLLAALVVGILYGGYGTTLPIYMACRFLGLYNSYASVIVPSLFPPVMVWFFVKYMASIPEDMLSMGRLDGLGVFGLLWHVVVPMCGPPIAGMMGLTIVGSWHSYMWPMIMIKNTKLQVLAVAIREVVWLDELRKFMSNPNLALAGAVILTIPAIALFLISQKYMETGLFAKATGGE